MILPPTRGAQTMVVEVIFRNNVSKINLQKKCQPQENSKGVSAGEGKSLATLEAK